uniref:Uncharacterized protein n=1 Tax=Junco hyemalis TaxID=40217 RepID=A0A8C5NM68_JUNHY
PESNIPREMFLKKIIKHHKPNIQCCLNIFMMLYFSFIYFYCNSFTSSCKIPEIHRYFMALHSFSKKNRKQE